MKKFLVCFCIFAVLFSLNNVCFMTTSDSWQNGDIVERSQLDEDDPNYWIKIYDSSKKSVRYTENIDLNFVPNECKTQALIPYTTSATKYNVYSSLVVNDLNEIFE